MNRIMKETNIPWIGQIPEDWQVCRFKDLAYSKKEVAGNKAENYERLALTLKGVIKRSKEDDKGLQPSDFYTYQILNSGDFIFKMIDLQNVSTSRVGLSPFTGLVSPAYVRFIPKDGINKEFYYFYLMSLYYQKVFNNIAGDGVRSALNAGDLSLIECPIPSKEEQIEIVKAIKDKEEKINALIANEEKQIEKLKAYKQVLISEVVTKGLDPNVPMKHSGIDWIDEIPQNWSVIRFKYVAKLENGKEVTSTNGNIPVYGSGGIFKYTDSYLYDGPSLLTGRKGTIDNPMLVNGKFWTVDTMFYTSKIMNIDYKFLYYAYLGCTNFHFYKTGSVLPSMTQTNINNIFLTYPNSKVQKEISTYLDSKIKQIENLIVKKNEIVQKLKLYYQSMIYEYVTGKRKVY